MIKIIESPREAMQGMVQFIPTDLKVRYIDALLKVGFDTVEVGSFVSPKAIPQMSDSEEVIKRIQPTATKSDKMVLVVNIRGAQNAAGLGSIQTISYPFSLSPTFSDLNLNSTPEKQFETVCEIDSICKNAGKSFVLYISMAFGNPYGDEWNLELLTSWVARFQVLGITRIALSNVSIEIGKKLIEEVYFSLIPAFPGMEIGLHLHTSNEGWYEKVEAAYNAGCRRFDAVMNGFGGCPMTGKELLGNLSTENLVQFLEKNHALPVEFDHEAFTFASGLAREILGASPS
ncbi:MAG: hydroxymethylglutaryl-CoA lyase [Bacteroidota bacterium]